jgi:electron transfer DM13
MKNVLRTHWRATLTVGLAALAGIIFVLVWFQPQKLFLEKTVDEAFPTAQRPTESPSGLEASPHESGSRASVLASGSFQCLEHKTSGTAKIVELNDGHHFLRFEGLSTSSGPDLRVYLSEIPVSNDWHAYGERFVDLGALKGNIGDQNYVIPDAVDLSRYRSAVIWCRRFTVGFGVAGLS